MASDITGREILVGDVVVVPTHAGSLAFFFVTRVTKKTISGFGRYDLKSLCRAYKEMPRWTSHIYRKHSCIHFMSNEEFLDEVEQVYLEHEN